jgi:hypothetical protein
VREKPILFNTEMVRAILEGRKTMTRRVVKPQPPEGIGPIVGPEMFEPAITDKYGELKEGKPIFGVYDEWGEWGTKCPYQPGDTLWVRETWANYQTVNYIRRPDGRAFSEVSDGLAAYKADGFDSIQDLKDHIRLMSDSSLEAVLVDGDRWKPSIHMPQWAARLFLTVKDVRIERLQEITEEDAEAEGVKPFPYDPEGDIWTDGKYRTAFNYLWNQINGWNPNAWDANPWLWVISFEVQGRR